MGFPEALMGRPGGGGIGRPDELSGGRGGRVAPGPGPTGGPVRGAVLGGAEDAAAAAAAASRSIEGVTGRGGEDADGASSGAMRVEAAAVRWDETTRAAAGGRGGGVGAALAGAAGAGAGRDARAGSGSAGETARRSPSVSARRRTRSAWASSIDDEWLFTPMPREMARSSASLFVSPSSLASS
jgi:hypothetical protein